MLTLALVAGITVGSVPKLGSLEATREAFVSPGYWEGSWSLGPDAVMLKPGFMSLDYNGLLIQVSCRWFDEGGQRCGCRLDGHDYIGIYSRQGDSLVIRMTNLGQEHPTNLEPNKTGILFTLKRVNHPK